MIYLLLCVAANVAIFMSFRAYKKFGIDTLQAIVVNYAVCVVTGIVFLPSGKLSATMSVWPDWGWAAFVLGFFFIFTFNLMAVATQRVGVTAASVASKISMVVPVVVNLFFLSTAAKVFTQANYWGLFLAFLAVLLTSISREKNNGAKKMDLGNFWLPLSVFALGGFLDTSMNLVNLYLLPEADEGVFPIAIFAMAFVVGLVFIGKGVLGRQRKWAWKNIVGGVCLGIPNYFSIYFLLKSLRAFNNDGALVFPLVNVLVIVASALAAILLFKEVLNRAKKLGLFTAMVSIGLLSYQEWMEFLRNW